MSALAAAGILAVLPACVDDDADDVIDDEELEQLEPDVDVGGEGDEGGELEDDVDLEREPQVEEPRE